MNIPVLSQLISLIEEILKAHGPAVAKAAEAAAVGAAYDAAEQDPKVQAVTEASVVLLQAAKSLKAAIDAPPAPPAAA